MTPSGRDTPLHVVSACLWRLSCWRCISLERSPRADDGRFLSFPSVRPYVALFSFWRWISLARSPLDEESHFFAFMAFAAFFAFIAFGFAAGAGAAAFAFIALVMASSEGQHERITQKHF